MVSKLTYALVMAMKEDTFKVEATSNETKRKWLEEAVTRSEVRKVYPRIRVYDEEKDKYIYVADKTQKPSIKTSPISFFSLKKAYCEEVLKIEKASTKKETFRDRLIKK